MNHILEAQQFEREWLEQEFFPEVEALEITTKNSSPKPLAGKEMVSFFYEPSTRTRLSFELAMRRLGGEVVFSTDHAAEFSSVAKGETIEDTMRVLCAYRPPVDVIVLRTNMEGMAQRAAAYSSIPIINAGDGTGQHPTQALTDIYTIFSTFRTIDNTTIAMCGDLNRSRTVRSLAYLYAKFLGVKIYFVSPEPARMRPDIKEYLTAHNVPFEEVFDLRDIADRVDIIYSTRIQKERGELLSKYGPKAFWTVDQSVLDKMRKGAIVMHPLPHLEEIAAEADPESEPRSVYFQQAGNGLQVRMAILKMILA